MLSWCWLWWSRFWDTQCTKNRKLLQEQINVYFFYIELYFLVDFYMKCLFNVNQSNFFKTVLFLMPRVLWFSEINGQCFGIVHDVQSCHPWVERSLYNVAPSEAQKGLISAVCVILISLDLRTILFSNRAQKRVHLRSIFFFSSAQLFGIIFLFRLDTIWQGKNRLIFEKKITKLWNELALYS